MSLKAPRKATRKLGLVAVFSLTVAGQLAPRPTMAAAEPEWLTVANLYRGSAGLAPVSENPAATAGAIAHSKYLMKNHTISHGEIKGTPGYSSEGVQGGETGNVATGAGGLVGERETIESWMTAPFHGLAMLSPNSQPYGYGMVTSGTNWAATLSHSWGSYTDPDAPETVGPLQTAVATVERAFPEVARTSWSGKLTGDTIVITFTNRRFLVTGEKVRELQAGEPPFGSVVWPGNGSSVPLVRYAGSEWPDPLPACKGWTKTAGLPLLIHRSVPTIVKSATLTDSNGTPLVVCSIDAQSYTHPNPDDTTYARRTLENDAIIMPKLPLIPGHSYRAHVELADGEVLDWAFGTTTDGSIKLPPGSQLEGRAIPGIPFQPVIPAAVVGIASSKTPTLKTPAIRAPSTKSTPITKPIKARQPKAKK
jgi:uncharacterized protein YkwD